MNRNNILALLFICFILLLSSCDNEIHLCDTWKETTVVYGILDPADTNTYLRITKAFLGEGNVYNMAKVIDSSEYNPDEINVTIEEWQNNQKIKVFPFKAEYINNKEDGNFYNPKQMVFVSNTINQLNINSTYKLIIINSSKDTLTSQTILVDSALYVTKPYSYTSSLPVLYTNLRFPTVIEWKPVNNGVRYNLSGNFYVVEVYNNGDSAIRCISRGSMYTCTSDAIKANGFFETTDHPDAFLSFVKNNIIYSDKSKEDEVAYRKVGLFELIFSIAGESLNKYISITNANTSLSENQAIYSNINNGVGIFSARSKKYYPCQISEPIKDLLYNDIKYSDLKFSNKD